MLAAVKSSDMCALASLAGRVLSGSWSEIHDLAGGCSVGTGQKREPAHYEEQ